MKRLSIASICQHMNDTTLHNKKDFNKIAVLENAIEAQLMGSILTELDIPHRIRSYHDTALNGLYQVQKGWGNIEAPESYQTEIIQILEGIRTNPPIDEPSGS
jgi:hypothetical protein